QHEGVDEEADQRLGGGGVAAGGGGAHGHVVPPGQPRQQRVHGREQHHVDGDAVLAGQFAHAVGGQVEQDVVAALGERVRAGPVGGQVEGFQAGQPGRPVLQAPLLGGGTLVDGVVGVLDAERRQLP